MPGGVIEPAESIGCRNMTPIPAVAKLTSKARYSTATRAGRAFLAACLLYAGLCPPGAMAEPAPASRVEHGAAIVPVIEMAFSSDWDPRRYGRFGLPATRIEEIRRELSELARESFTRRLQAAGYAVLTEPSPAALSLRLRIFDVYINAPVLDDADRRDSYVFAAGEMSLELELRAAGSTEVLARMQDRHIDPGNGFLVLANEISNRSAARRIFDGWAERLVRQLERAGSDPARNGG